MDYEEYYNMDTSNCKELGGFCNFTHFQTWFCEWNQMDLVEELCPIPTACCVPKRSRISVILHAIFSLRTLYYVLSIFISLILIILAGKMVIRVIKRKVSIHSSPSPVCAPTPSSTPPPSTPTHAPTPVTDDWAIKTMLKLFPTVPRKEIKIGQRISEGHFCVIHRAIWRDSAVAIKSMQIEATHLEIFLNEAAVLWRLRMSGHLFKSMPLHICNFHGLYSGKQNQIGIVMEYMNLGSLAAFFHEQKVSTNIVRELQPKDLIRIAVQACTGLLQLQTLLIMHGNISARNFLLSGDPFRPEKLVVKLADFGLAQMLSHKDEVYIYWDGERKGWPFKWMAPETFVVSGEEQENFEFSLYSDIWSFGVFLLELFTQCSNPYENLEPSEVRSMLMVDPKMNPLNYNNELFNATFPRDLKRIVRKCFGIMPKDRPKSEKLLKMLQQIAF